MLPQGYSPFSTDCDDDNIRINPEAEEICDGLDNDCDELVDDDDDSVTDQATWFSDADGDGYGSSETFVFQCTRPSDFVANDLDCDDLDFISPDESEVCDGLDNDCNGDIDDNATDAVAWFIDTDGDGFAGPTTELSCTQPSNGSTDNDDCDDGNINIFPGAPELCDEIDNNCNNQIDDNAIDVIDYYRDVDEDGFGDLLAKTEACDLPNGFSDNADDCDDGNSQINPTALEVCDNDDNDCDGLVDDDDDDLDPDTQTEFGADEDGDGFGSDNRYCVGM